jgi:hypothetical protein
MPGIATRLFALFRKRVKGIPELLAQQVIEVCFKSTSNGLTEILTTGRTGGILSGALKWPGTSMQNIETD